ncbi:MAG: SDR family oxidoreductase [Nitrososphaerales archaeon]|jgi:NAD(P)-dependent dehydrogenase (short-subunit alcohol dehydrogenase family)
MKGKVCIVTGTSAGIGKATAIGLAKLDATVVAVMRDSEKSNAALTEIRMRSGKNESVVHIAADLSSQKSISEFVKEFNARFDRLDVLLNNAGVSQFKRILTADGIEMTFAVNVLAPFLLTNLLTEKLKASAPSRIVNVSSASSNGAKIDFDNLQGEKKYSTFGIYGQSKLALNLITVELSRRLAGTDVTANFLHPGVIRTELGTRDVHPVLKAIAGFVKLFMGSPEKGARTSIYLASSPEVEGITGKYFANQKEVTANPISFDEATAKQLWKICEDMTRPSNPSHVAAAS